MWIAWATRKLYTIKYMIQPSQQYVWDNIYKPRALALGNDRRAHTVSALKQLIVDMFAMGFSAPLIASLLAKDHTTIYYHLGALATNKPPRSPFNYSVHREALEVRLAQTKVAREEKKEVIRIRKELRQEREQIRAQAKDARDEELRERARKGDDVHKRVAAQREEAMKLYKKGLSYRRIAIEIGVNDSRVQGLIQVHPDFRKVARAIDYNRQREVQQYTPQGQLIATYRSTKEAANAVKAASGPMSLAARGIIKTYKGFVWRYGETVDLLKFKLEK